MKKYKGYIIPPDMIKIFKWRVQKTKHSIGKLVSIKVAIKLIEKGGYKVLLE